MNQDPSAPPPHLHSVVMALQATVAALVVSHPSQAELLRALQTFRAPLDDPQAQAMVDRTIGSLERRIARHGPQPPNPPDPTRP